MSEFYAANMKMLSEADVIISATPPGKDKPIGFLSMSQSTNKKSIHPENISLLDLGIIDSRDLLHDIIRAKSAEDLLAAAINHGSQNFKYRLAKRKTADLCLQSARCAIGIGWGLNRPLKYSELARALRMKGEHAADQIRKWERGNPPPSGPASIAIEMMLAGHYKPPLDQVLRLNKKPLD